MGLSDGEDDRRAAGDDSVRVAQETVQYLVRLVAEEDRVEQPGVFGAHLRDHELGSSVVCTSSEDGGDDAGSEAGIIQRRGEDLSRQHVGGSREPSAQCGSVNRRAASCRCRCVPGGGVGEVRHHVVGDPGAASVVSRELGLLGQGDESRDSGGRAEGNNPLGERFHCADAAWGGFVLVASGVPTTPADEGLHIWIDVQSRKVASFVAGPRVCGVEHASSTESEAGRGLEQMMQGSQHASSSLRSLVLLFPARFAVVGNESCTEPYP